MTRVLVFGTGSVGSVYAYVLHKGGAEVTTVCRSNYDAVINAGINIKSNLWGELHFKPAHVVKSVQDATSLSNRAPYDYILVTSKAFPDDADKIAAAVTEGQTAIVLAQNGIRIEEEYARAFPTNTILSGVVYLPATQTGPGHVKVGDIELLELGTYPAAPLDQEDSKPVAQLKRFQSLFAEGGATCTLFADVQTQRWIKLAVNAAWNPICALTRASDTDFLRSSQADSPAATSTSPDANPDSKDTNGGSTYHPGPAESSIRAIFNEIAIVASAAGYPVLTPEVIEYHLTRARTRVARGGPGNEPSMLADVRNGRRVEVEAILGNFLKVAQEVRVGEERIPRLSFLYVLLRGLDGSIGREGGV